ncbi:hypothetical protein EDB83DRAFT_2531929 [Lactarius deliciosus]|nr:hypothetical protein EDB83DRAFT_2531929 [Lactarius deliciosus]
MGCDGEHSATGSDGTGITHQPATRTPDDGDDDDDTGFDLHTSTGSSHSRGPAACTNDSDLAAAAPDDDDNDRDDNGAAAASKPFALLGHYTTSLTTTPSRACLRPPTDKRVGLAALAFLSLDSPFPHPFLHSLLLLCSQDDDDDEWAVTEGTRPPARPHSPSATGPPIATCTHDDDDTGCDGHSAPAPVSRAPPMAMVTATGTLPQHRPLALAQSPATCTPYDDDEGDTESPTPLQLPQTMRPYDDNSYGGSDGGKGYNNAAATARDCAHPCDDGNGSDTTPLPLPRTPTRFDDDNSSNSDVEYLDSTTIDSTQYDPQAETTTATSTPEHYPPENSGDTSTGNQKKNPAHPSQEPQLPPKQATAESLRLNEPEIIHVHAPAEMATATVTQEELAAEEAQTVQIHHRELANPLHPEDPEATSAKARQIHQEEEEEENRCALAEEEATHSEEDHHLRQEDHHLRDP